ncbi:MAG: RecX family transcriptional regulator [Bacteroidales bacterium]|jgi:regulatory protein|nr:RecX family transcriptional regulator [Bacteroidales bacterium]
MDKNILKTDIPPEILEKIKRFCAYQERCPFDIRNKLISWKVSSSQINEIIAILEQEDYLNEERFAEAYVRGKFTIKGWGLQKISHALHAKHVSKNHIDAALAIISDRQQMEKMKQVALKWLQTHPEEDNEKCKQKLFNYLVSKGYNYHLCSKMYFQYFSQWNKEKENVKSKK